MIFQESDLLFHFQKGWVIKQYDTNPYFRRLKGAGLKGIDFLGIFEKREVVFFEVKNYKIRYKEKPPTQIYDVLENPKLLAEKVAQKVEDTLQAIRVINKFYRRRRIYRIFEPLLKVIPNWNATLNTWLFWTRVEVFIERGDWQVILWLETEEVYKHFSKAQIADFRNQLQQLLQTRLAGIAPSISILSTQNQPFIKQLDVED